MLQSLFLAVVMFVGPGGFAPKPAAKPATQPAPAAQLQQQQQQQQQQQPQGAQAAPVAAASTADDGTIGQIFGRTRMGQLVEGKTRVTIDDVKDPLFWVD